MARGTNDQRYRILIVDDEVFVCEILSRWLSEEGYVCDTCAGAVDALELLAEREYALVLSDIRMPEITGIELLETIKHHFPKVAVLMVTGMGDRQTAIQTLQAGAFGYIVKPFDQNEILINVASALERRRLVLQSEDYQHRLEEEVQERTAEIRQREEELAYRLVAASEWRDNETGAHIRRIGLYSATLAEEMGWSKTDVDDIRVAASMHDIGKIGVPDAILLKPGKLTTEEFEIIKQHTQIGAAMLENSGIPLLQTAREIAMRHHERFDGKGYPDGMAGEDIPLPARIVAVVDVYDALVHERVYKKAIPEDEAIQIMQAENGAHFDPVVFDAFLRRLPDIRRIRLQVRERDGLLTWQESVRKPSQRVLADGAQ